MVKKHFHEARPVFSMPRDLRNDAAEGEAILPCLREVFLSRIEPIRVKLGRKSTPFSGSGPARPLNLGLIGRKTADKLLKSMNWNSFTFDD
jgi:hypothetical protein